MSLSLCSFSSGSSGNSYLIKGGGGAILIDAGISASRILSGLERTGTARADVKALFVTHGHWDHVTGARVLLKKLPGADVYASAGTMEELERRDAGQKLTFAREVAQQRKKRVAPAQPVEICGLTVRAFRTLHDAAEPLGFAVTDGGGGGSVAIVTDTGLFTDDILYSVADADLLVLEANHDTEMLRSGSYPWHLKQRILSEVGHLSNAQAAEALARVFSLNAKKRVVLLAHLSQENNTPRLAEQTVCTLLAREGIFTGGDFHLGVLRRDMPSDLYRL
ncbi:MAG: MBL fold metallo-hydrolase [Clostridiales Family XIII bacterium]|jgi:phosphoribosyl 1,2-cyclic phosphodiesterase|nr:MBL fold metallo-hydrolase [Clostridiales Family XIII bacterium]